MTAVVPPRSVRAPAVRLIHGGRSRKQSERDITTTTMRLRAVAADPSTYLMSLAVPVRPPRTPGRPGAYPHWAYTVFAALINVTGSARTAAAELEDEQTWRMFVDGAREHLGQHAVDGVPATGPMRHHWNTWAATYGAYNVAPLGEAFRALALAQAREQGLLDADAPGTLARPHRVTQVTGDGKVMTAPCRNREPFRVDKATGEMVPQRVDSASSDWKEGGEQDGKPRWEFGSKFVALSVRDNPYYGRVVLDIEHLPHDNDFGGEAGLAVEMLLRLKDEVGDGMKAAVWDGALAGVHIDKLMRAGLLVVSPMTAAKNPKGAKKGPDRVEKSAVLDTYDGGDGCPGHDLWAIGGAVHERHVLADNTLHDEPLRFRLLKGGGGDEHRWYHEVRIPCGHPDDDGKHPVTHTTTVAVYRTKDDAKRGRRGGSGFNRAEYLRQNPPGTEDYDYVYRARPDAESLNAQLESMHYFHRLPAYGAARQTLVMLGAVMSENSVSRYHHARRQAQAAAAA